MAKSTPKRKAKTATVNGQSSRRKSSSRRALPFQPQVIRKPKLHFEWTQAITDDQWKIYLSAIQAMRAAGIRFMLGGGFAMASYTGRWRNTKDIDLYIIEADREKAIGALTHAGFTDYFEVKPYERHWIYRSTQSGVIVDIIWGMANRRAKVDEHWFEAAPDLPVRGEALHVVPMEEFVWCKLYIIQRDHCDWTDVLNVLYAAGTRVDWNRLLWRLEEDWPLLKGLLTLYGWLCPKQAVQLPEFLRRKLTLDPPEIPKRQKRDRASMLDSRGWFTAKLAPNEKLEV